MLIFDASKIAGLASLREHIEAHPAITSLQSTDRSLTDGIYRVLSTKKDINQARQYVYYLLCIVYHNDPQMPRHKDLLPTVDKTTPPREDGSTIASLPSTGSITTMEGQSGNATPQDSAPTLANATCPTTTEPQDDSPETIEQADATNRLAAYQGKHQPSTMREPVTPATHTPSDNGTGQDTVTSPLSQSALDDITTQLAQRLHVPPPQITDSQLRQISDHITPVVAAAQPHIDHQQLGKSLSETLNPILQQTLQQQLPAMITAAMQPQLIAMEQRLQQAQTQWLTQLHHSVTSAMRDTLTATTMKTTLQPEDSMANNIATAAQRAADKATAAVAILYNMMDIVRDTTSTTANSTPSLPPDSTEKEPIIDLVEGDNDDNEDIEDADSSEEQIESPEPLRPPQQQAAPPATPKHTTTRPGWRRIINTATDIALPDQAASPRHPADKRTPEQRSPPRYETFSPHRKTRATETTESTLQSDLHTNDQLPAPGNATVTTPSTPLRHQRTNDTSHPDSADYDTTNIGPQSPPKCQRSPASLAAITETMDGGVETVEDDNEEQSQGDDLEVGRRRSERLRQSTPLK